MEADKRFRFRRGDWAAVALVLLLGLLAMGIFGAGAARAERVAAEVWQDGKLLCVLPLDRDATYTVEGAYRNTITVSGGKVWISESDCPTQDCVHSGAISGGGQVLVCLPNWVEVRLTGSADVDFVVG